MRFLTILLLFLAFDANAWMERWAPEFKTPSAKYRKLSAQSVTNFVNAAWGDEGEESIRPQYSQGVALYLDGDKVEDTESLHAKLGARDDPYLEVAGSQWSFAVNVPTNAPDTFPVMITANVTPEIVPRSWDGKSGRDDVLDLVPLMSENPLPKIGLDAIVVIRKCGAAQILKRRYITRRNLLPTEPYDLGKDTYYLTPTGKVYPK